MPNPKQGTNAAGSSPLPEVPNNGEPFQQIQIQVKASGRVFLFGYPASMTDDDLLNVVMELVRNLKRSSRGPQIDIARAMPQVNQGRSQA